jgi:hypothetical protein
VSNTQQQLLPLLVAAAAVSDKYKVLFLTLSREYYFFLNQRSLKFKIHRSILGMLVVVSVGETNATNVCADLIQSNATCHP